MALGAKNKLCFIDGSCKRPEADSANLQKWIRNDYMVQSWLINSMEASISEGFILQQFTQQLYDEIKARYGHYNAPQLFELHKKMTSKQDSNTIVEYYSKLKRVWDEIQLLDGFPDCDCGALAKCTCGLLEKVLAADQKQKLIRFLVGLNSGYDTTKTNILSMDPLPTVNRAYYILLQVERQNKLSENSTTTTPSIGAFASMKHTSSRSQQSLNVKKDYKKARYDKHDRHCDHCKRSGHTRDQCFKLTGYHEWFLNMKNKQSSAPHSKMAANVVDLSNGYYADTPLEFDVNKSCSKDAQVDPTLVNDVYKEMMKLMKGKHVQNESGDQFHSFINFAGN